jgi:LacI family transcriptional regulator
MPHLRSSLPQRPQITIGLVGSIGDELAGRAMDGMLAFASAHPGLEVHDLRITDGFDGPPEALLVPTHVHRDGVHGIVVATPRFGLSAAMAGWLKTYAAVPTVVIGATEPGTAVSIDVDPEAIAGVAAGHLTACHCRSFLYVGSAHRPGSAVMASAFRTAIGRVTADYTCPVRLCGGVEDVHLLATDGTLARILDRLPRPVGTVCIDDVHAAALGRACTAMGLVVPEDVAIVGVGDTSLARHVTPSVTSIRLPSEAMGARALGFLVAEDRSAGMSALVPPAVPPPAVLVAVEPRDLVPRESTTGRGDVLAAGQWLAYVRGRADRVATVSRLAAELGVSRRQFERQFTRLVGRAPSQELQQVRIERAIRLLADPTLSVTDVGSLLGFSETAAFSRFFRKHTGESPRAYRRRELARSVALKTGRG